MKYENAYRSAVQFMESNESKEFDLSEAQVEELAKRIAMRVKVDIVMQPEAVLSHATALFPPPDPDYVRRTTPPKQSREQAIAVIVDFLNHGWKLVAPGCLLPTDASKTNHKLFFDEVNARFARGELIRQDFLADIGANLFHSGVLEKEKPASPVVPAPPPPSSPQEQARELAKKIAAQERSLNDRTKSPIRGAREAAEPLISSKVVLTEGAKAALNEKAARDNAIVQEALSRINTFTGYSHSKTYSGRAALREVFKSEMDLGKSAEDVLAAVEAEADRLAGNSSVR